MTYGVISDLHCHDWSAFSSTMSDGVNSRLRLTLDEIDRVCEAVKVAGGSEVVIAGDIFHNRGSIDPEVLNPTRAVFLKWMANGINFLAIPGNHDLKSDEANELSSAITNLGLGARFRIFNKPTVHVANGLKRAFVPWRKTRERLIKDIESVCPASVRGDVDLFLHVGIDGVISGMPDHGLTAKELADFGFRRVFAGHYHNHKVMEDGKVISIGSTTQQTWSDVGTRAGFLLVDDTSVQFRAARAPSFVDISGMPMEDIELATPGNYVRLRGSAMTPTEIQKIRQLLENLGALGVSIQVAVAPVTGVPLTKRGVTLEESIDSFVDGRKLPSTVDKEVVVKMAIEVLAEARLQVQDA